MRDKFAEVIYQIGKKNKKIAVLVADISPAGAISEFKKNFPERFINTGVAEQSMIGIAGGLAITLRRKMVGGIKPILVGYFRVAE